MCGGDGERWRKVQAGVSGKFRVEGKRGRSCLVRCARMGRQEGEDYIPPNAATHGDDEEDCCGAIVRAGQVDRVES